MTCYIELTKDAVTLVDDEDFEWLNQWKWYCTSKKYAARARRKAEGPGSFMIFMHRMVGTAMGLPVDQRIDHRNRDKLDNRRANLRSTTNSLNAVNAATGCRPISGYRGVAIQARITINGRRRIIGHYATPEQAARAFDRAAVEAFGEHALGILNFRDEEPA